MVEVSFWGGGGELGLNGLVHVKGLVVTHTAHTASPPHKVSFGVHLVFCQSLYTFQSKLLPSFALTDISERQKKKSQF